jgi:hypothetical protein
MSDMEGVVKNAYDAERGIQPQPPERDAEMNLTTEITETNRKLIGQWLLAAMTC